MNRWRVLLPVLGCCVAALIFLELLAVFHVVDYRNVIGGNPLHANYIDDPELVFVHRPNSRLAGSQKGGFASKVYDVPLPEQPVYRWDVTYNQHGLRYASDLKSSEIVAVGDSCVEGTTVADPQLMTTLLTKLGGQPVANLGHNGYGPQQELIVLKRYGLPLHPKTVIWVFSENTDIGDAASYESLARNASNSWILFKDRTFAKNALTYLRTPKGTQQPRERGRGILHTATGTVNTYFTFMDVVSAQPLTQRSLRGLEETARTLRDAANSCAAQGCRVVFAFSPDKFRVLHDFCTFSPQFNWSNHALNDLPERLAARIETMSPGMKYLDLTPALRDAVESGVMPFSVDDGHLNEEGEKIAATTLANYLTTHASDK